MIRTVVASLFCVMLFSGSTCERSVSLELELPAPELVLICTFTPGRPFAASVSSTRPRLIPSQTEYILDAGVSLLREDVKLEAFKLVHGEGVVPPYYRSVEYVPSEGISYTLQVAAPGFKTVTAQGIVPAQVRIRSIQAEPKGLSPSANHNEMILNYNISVTFDDPTTQRNFYHLRFQQEILEYRLTENGDTLLTGRRLDHVAFGPAINNNTITAYLEDGVLFEDHSFNGRRVSFSFPMQTRISTNRELPGHLYTELRAVSDDYYRFYISVGRNQDNPGPPFSEPVIVYSNVENGRGIFAGYHASMDSIPIRW